MVQVLSPMSAYFDGPPSFFPGQAASAAPLPGLEEAAEHSTVQRERPVVPQQATLEEGKSTEFLGDMFFSSKIWGEGEGFVETFEAFFFSQKKNLGKSRLYCIIPSCLLSEIRELVGTLFFKAFFFRDVFFDIMFLLFWEMFAHHPIETLPYINRFPSGSTCLSNDQFINFGCFTHVANSTALILGSVT